MATNVDDICAICQEPLKESWWQRIKRNLKGERYSICTPEQECHKNEYTECKHIYHTKCLKIYYDEFNFIGCPICSENKHLTLDDLGDILAEERYQTRLQQNKTFIF